MDKGQALGDVDRADRAERLLRDETLQEALNSLTTAYIEAWEEAETVEKREGLWYCLQAKNDFVRHLGKAVKQGTIAKKDLEIHGGHS